MGANKFIKTQLFLGTILSYGAWAYRSEDVDENVQAASHRASICSEITTDYLDFLSDDECRNATLKVKKRYYDVLPTSTEEEMTGYAWTFEKGELQCNGSVTLNIKKPYIDSEGRLKWATPTTKWTFLVEKCGSEALSALKNANVGDDNVKRVGLSFDVDFPWEDGAPADEDDEVLPTEIPREILNKLAEELSILSDRPDYNWVMTEYYQVKNAEGAVIGYIGEEGIHNTEDSDNYTIDTVSVTVDLEGRVVKASDF